MSEEPPIRLSLSCGEAGDVITAVNRLVATFDPATEAERIREVAQRLHDEAGWSQNVVDSYVEMALRGELF